MQFVIIKSIWLSIVLFEQIAKTEKLISKEVWLNVYINSLKYGEKKILSFVVKHSFLPFLVKIS